MPKVSVQKLNWHQWPEFAPTWERIHQLCQDASFFLSREWVDCWLATFGAELNPDLLVFVRADEVVGCCLLVWRTQWVRGIPLRRVYLNCAGEDEADSTFIEYNSLLAIPDDAEQVAEALGEFLRSRRWDELLLQGVTGGAAFCSVAGTLGSVETSISPSHYVDLYQLRKDAGEFDKVLSSNTRGQVRRSRRLYEQTLGLCSIHSAMTCGEAMEILDRLSALHQITWRNRGRRGVFASPKFSGFHRRLIESAFDRHTVLLLELCAGTETVGAIYSFLFRGRIYFYQSGFRYTSDGRLKPGLLTHYSAICHYLEQPEMKEYDFLAGDSQYQRSLGTATRSLQWIIVRRPTVPSLLFRGLRKVKRTYEGTFGKGTREDQPSVRD